MNLSKLTATTVLKGNNGPIIVRYHDTNIFEMKGNKVTLDSGGWRTVSTKRHINQCFEAYRVPLQVFQADHQWYVSRHCNRDKAIPFTDGMTLEV